jgi:hypothetical protein
MKKVVKESKVTELGFHIEMDHERELPGFWSFKQLWEMHSQMHILNDDWDHEHSDP